MKSKVFGPGGESFCSCINGSPDTDRGNGFNKEL